MIFLFLLLVRILQSSYLAFEKTVLKNCNTLRLPMQDVPSATDLAYKMTVAVFSSPWR